MYLSRCNTIELWSVTDLLIMPRDRVSAEDKQCIIDAYVNGEDYVETAKLLSVKRTTTWGIVRRYQLHGQVNQPRGGARNRKSW